ncbi:hypothetical protein Tco_1098600 [Tanacetum coccineum]
MGGSYYSFPCSILSTGKDCKTPQRYLDVPTTSWRISIRSMDSFQGLTPKTSLIMASIFGSKSKSSMTMSLPSQDEQLINRPAISLPQDVLSTSNRRLIELENQIQRLMEAHLALTQPTQVNKITSSYEICSGPHDTQYWMENPEQAFDEYASLRTDEARGARLSKFEADFKRQQSMTNKIDTVMKAIIDRMAGALPSDMVKNPKLNVNSTTSVLSARSYPTEDPQCSTHTHEFVYTKGDDGDVMFIEIVKKNDDSRKEEPEAGGLEVEYFDIFPTRSELAYHKYLMCGPILSIFLRNPIIAEGCPSNLKIACNIGNFTYATDFMIVEDISSIIDPRLSQVIEQYNSLSDLEKEHTKSVYLRNEEDKSRRVEYMMSKILGFYKECLELGPEYVTGMDDEGEVTLYLIRRSLEVLRKFHWMILGGRFNQLSHVSHS